MASPEKTKPPELSKIDQKLRGNTASSGAKRSIFIPPPESANKNSILIVENQQQEYIFSREPLIKQESLMMTQHKENYKAKTKIFISPKEALNSEAEDELDLEREKMDAVVEIKNQDSKLSK